MARELGISRAAVGKRVGTLRERGFDIDARARRGYRLRALPDSLEPAGIYFGTTQGDLFYSRDGGDDWERLPGQFSRITSLAVHVT